MCAETAFPERKMHFLYGWSPSAEHYGCLREKVVERTDRSAAYFLAEYQRPDDIDLILDNLPKSQRRGDTSVDYGVLRRFQHPRIFNFLRSPTSG